MNRAELLRFDGTPRSVLEARIRLLVPVLDAAAVLVAADDVAGSMATEDQGTADERYERSCAVDEQYERAWDELRCVLSSITR